MNHHRDARTPRGGGEGPDPVLARSLQVIDPADRDPMYWFRFRDRVMSSAARELARRRMLADLTIADLVASWSRTLVPAAMIAAALAGFVLMRGEERPSLLPLAVEEILTAGLDGVPIPTELTSEDQVAQGGVMFASEAY